MTISLSFLPSIQGLGSSSSDGRTLPNMTEYCQEWQYEATSYHSRIGQAVIIIQYIPTSSSVVYHQSEDAAKPMATDGHSDRSTRRRIRARHTKSRKGCFTCKGRRVKVCIPQVAFQWTASADAADISSVMKSNPHAGTVP